MKLEKKENKLMTEGNIVKQIFFFSVPLILGNLLQQLYNTADSVIVGNFVGKNALAAAGAGTSLISLLISFTQGTAVGTGVLVAQYLGAGDKKGVSDAVHTAMVLSLVLGALLSAGGLVFSRTLLIWMGTPEDVLDDSALYLKIYFSGMLFSVLYNMASGILNAAGNSKRSLLYLACASLTNIVLDLVTVGLLDMGVAGAALATTVSQLVSCVLAIRYLLRSQADYRLQLRELGIKKGMTGRILRIGLPTGIQNMVISFSNVLVQSSVNVYGSAAMAGFGAYMKIDGFNILPVSSFSMAATTFVGQNYGAGKIDRVKKGMWATLAMGFAYTIMTGVLLLVFAKPLVGLFNQDAQVIAVGTRAMLYFCPFYFLLSILHGLAGTVRGTGKSVPPMVILLTSLCLFRIVWLKLIMPALFTTIDGVFMVYPVSWALGVVLMVLYAWRGHWLTPTHNLAGGSTEESTKTT